MSSHPLPNHKKGDTFPGELFRMRELINGEPIPMDLTGVQIHMDVRVSPTSPIVIRFSNMPISNPVLTKGTLSIVDALEGRWQIDPQVVDIAPGSYVYDIQFAFPGTPNVIKTLIEGTWSITQDITHD